MFLRQSTENLFKELVGSLSGTICLRVVWCGHLQGYSSSLCEVPHQMAGEIGSLIAKDLLWHAIIEDDLVSDKLHRSFSSLRPNWHRNDPPREMVDSQNDVLIARD
jgi:hypothetical protein